MENLKTRYSLLEEQGVEKLPKIQEKMKRLGTLALGVENPSFPRTRRISGCFSNQEAFLTIQKT